MWSRLANDIVHYLHYRYCRGATISQLANHPLTQGVGLGRSNNMRTIRLTREFHGRDLHVRSSSENATMRHAQGRYGKVPAKPWPSSRHAQVTASAPPRRPVTPLSSRTEAAIAEWKAARRG
jgi:hypothetical protein